MTFWTAGTGTGADGQKKRQFLRFLVSFVSAAAVTALLSLQTPGYVSCEALLESHADGSGVVTLTLSDTDGNSYSGQALIDPESEKTQRISVRLRKPEGNDGTAEISLKAGTGSLTVKRLTIGGHDACPKEGEAGSSGKSGGSECAPVSLKVTHEEAYGRFLIPDGASAQRMFYPYIAFSVLVILTAVIMAVIPAAAGFIRRTAPKELIKILFSAAVTAAICTELLLYIDCTVYLTFPAAAIIIMAGAAALVIKYRKSTRQITQNMLFVITAASLCIIAALMTDSSLGIDTNLRKMLAEEPEPVLPDGRINTEFDSGYETWLVEHSKLRQSAASLLFLEQYANIVVRGRNHDTYISDETAFSGYDDTYTPDEEKIRALSRNMVNAQRHWGIPMLVLVYPVKPEIICGKTLMLRCARNSEIQTELLKKYTAGSGIVIANTADEVRRLMNMSGTAPENEIYFNDEHHMTQTSQDMLAEWLVREKLIPPSVSSLARYRTLENCSSGELIFRKGEPDCPLYGQSYGAVVGFDSRNEETALLRPRLHPYLSLSAAYNEDVSRIDHDGILTVLRNSRPDASPHTLLVAGNSYVESLSIALASRYREVIRYRIATNMSPIGLYHFDDLIAKEKPELIIVTMFQDRPFLYLSGLEPGGDLIREKKLREHEENANGGKDGAEATGMTEKED